MRKSKKAERIQMNLEERFRQLRTNIQFSQYDNDLKVINVVSTNPNEGKSTVSSNLAKIYAAQYPDVLVVDCDLRNPSLHKMLRLSNTEGLSNLMKTYTPNDNLKDAAEIKSYYLGEDVNPLRVLTTGQRVPNPQELLSSNRFAKLIEMMKEQFSIVIIDCPPCLAVSDAIPVCSAADGTLFVISAKDTDKNQAKEALNELQRNGANVFGAVLTKSENTNHNSGYYYYDYGYGYGYGSNDENTKRKSRRRKKDKAK